MVKDVGFVPARIGLTRNEKIFQLNVCLCASFKGVNQLLSHDGPLLLVVKLLVKNDHSLNRPGGGLDGKHLPGVLFLHLVLQKGNRVEPELVSEAVDDVLP